MGRHVPTGLELELLHTEPSGAIKKEAILCGQHLRSERERSDWQGHLLPFQTRGTDEVPPRLVETGLKD